MNEHADNDADPADRRAPNPYPRPLRPRRSPTIGTATTEGGERTETAAGTADSRSEGRTRGFDTLALPESSLSAMPLTNDALLRSLGLSPESENNGDGGDGYDRRGSTAAELVDGTEAEADAGSTDQATERDQTAERDQAAEPVDQRAPLWSDDWQAWIFWDSERNCWFRHDDAAGGWVPIET